MCTYVRKTAPIVAVERVEKRTLEKTRVSGTACTFSLADYDAEEAHVLFIAAFIVYMYYSWRRQSVGWLELFINVASGWARNDDRY